MPPIAMPSQETTPNIQDILESGPYQTDLPGEVDAGGHVLPPGGSLDFPVAVFFVIVGAVVLLLLIAVLTGSRRSARQRRAEPGGLAAHASLHDDPVSPLPDPAALARAGRFGEAVHVLLLAALRALAGGEHLLKRSWTSREVLRQVHLPDAAVEPLRGLVLAVERTQFGGQEASREDYETSRRQYQAFVRHVPETAS